MGETGHRASTTDRLHAEGCFLLRACDRRKRPEDLRKVILQQQAHNMLRILPIRLLLAPCLGRVSHPQLEVQLPHQSYEPACVSTGFHPHTHLLPPAARAR